MTPETKFRELERRAMAQLTRPLDAPELVDMIRASVIVLIWRCGVCSLKKLSGYASTWTRRC